MSNVILVGAFGQANPGDEALCAAFCHALVAHSLTVVSADPSATSAAFGVSSIPSHARSVAAAVRGADAVVIGGGTIFKRLHPSTGRGGAALLRNTATLVAGARARGVRTAAIGVGAGDLRGRTARALSRWIAPRLDLLVLRDEESASVLTDAGVRPPFWIASDPAWTLFDGTVADERGMRGRRTITVALSHLGGDRAVVDTLVETLQSLAADWTIRLQPWQSDRAGNDHDHALARTIHARVAGSEIIDPPDDLADAAATLAGDDLVIGLRFHALVAAAAAGTRFVAISHEPKLAAMARRMQQPSVPGYATADVMRATIACALDNEPPRPMAIEHEISAARDAFQLLDLLLADGAVAEPATIAGLALSTGRGTW